MTAIPMNQFPDEDEIFEKVAEFFKSGMPGVKTLAAAAALLVLAGVQAYEGNAEAAFQSIALALGLIGLRHAMGNKPASTEE